MLWVCACRCLDIYLERQASTRKTRYPLDWQSAVTPSNPRKQSTLKLLVYSLSLVNMESSPSAKSLDIHSTSRALFSTRSLHHLTLLPSSLEHHHQRCLTLLPPPTPTPVSRLPTPSRSSRPRNPPVTPTTCTRTHARCCVLPTGGPPSRRRRPPV